MATWSRWTGTSETPLTLQGRWNGTTVVTTTFSSVVGAASPTNTAKLGMDSPLGTEWTNAVANYPNIKYTRDFGTPTNLTPLGTGKFSALPAGAVMHVSWKGDVEQLSTWMNGLNQPIFLTWYHEPMGDVTPATYRSTAQRMADIVNAHAKKSFVLGNGPIVTRFWLDESDGNPADWGYPGMTHYGVDCYQDQPTAPAYFLTSKMFDVAFDKIHAIYPGLRLWVPEWGMSKINTDSTGSGRASAMQTQYNYLVSRGDVDGVAWFNNQASFPKYAFTSTSPEGVKFKQLSDGQ